LTRKQDGGTLVSILAPTHVLCSITLSKFLAENYSQDFASWLIGRPITLTELEPTELSIEPIRADTVILLESDDLILHCEFQTDPDPLMPLRMADYAIRIFRRFPNKRLIQVVIYLRKTRSPAVYKTTFSGNNLVHQFQVIRIWEQPTEAFLERPGLLGCDFKKCGIGLAEKFP
jgi:predicted transposase/invertase (TIGR01784 family)